MSRLNVSNLFNENEDGAPVVSGISTFSSPHYFVPPSGSTAQRPSNPGEGMIRFNTDSGHLEYYTGTHWADVIVKQSAPLGGRAVNIGGYDGSARTEIIDYVTISTTGNALDFGDVSSNPNMDAAACSSVTRGVWAGGRNPSPNTTTMQYLEFANLSDTITFGNLGTGRFEHGSCSDSTRGLFAGGRNPTAQSSIEQITFASTGTVSTFGALSGSRRCMVGASSPTRGIFAGGYSSIVDTIEYVTIQSDGTAQDFGNLSVARGFAGASTSSVRAVIGGGLGSPARVDTIDYVTTSTTGNAQDFGNLIAATDGLLGGGSSNQIRGIFSGGYTGSATNTIQYITIATTGDARDFGDLTLARNRLGSCSNGHGGL